MKLEGEGFDQSEVVATLAEKYGCSRDSVYRDIRLRHNWQPLLLDCKPQVLSLKIQNRLEQVYKKACFLLLNSKNECSQIGALKLMMDAIQALINFVGPLQIKDDPSNKAHVDAVNATLKDWENVVQEAVSLNMFSSTTQNYEDLTSGEKQQVVDVYCLIMERRSRAEEALH